MKLTMIPNKLQLLIFDMDGTITLPTLDFAKMKAEMAIPAEELILEHLDTLSPEDRHNKELILQRHEDESSRDSQLHTGAADLLQQLRHSGFKTALLTRNSQRSVDIILKKHNLSFDIVYTRDNAPAKPDPAPILAAIRQFSLLPQSVVMIGDFWMDILTGQAADVRTILFEAHEKTEEHPEAIPDARVGNYAELAEVLQKWNG